MKRKKIALIISLNFRAAHVSHLVASYHQMEELGYDSYCLVHEDALSFFPSDVKCLTSLDKKGFDKIAISIFWFPSVKNIWWMLKLKLFYGSKILYVFHEPVEKFSHYLKSGNSKWWTIKFFLKYYVGLIFLYLSDRVILPSDKAINLYVKGVSLKVNPNYDYLPLMYDDERTLFFKSKHRKYISYIGGVSKDHAFDEFVDYIYRLYSSDKNNDLSFLIASWRDVPEDYRIRAMKSGDRLKIISGKPMTNDEINSYYSSSFFVWNAYNRSTQSGVLAKAFMFGTPAIVMRKNLSEFVEDGREVIAVESNTDHEQLKSATYQLIMNFEKFSYEARENFNRNYHYKVQNDRMREILLSIGLPSDLEN